MLLVFGRSEAQSHIRGIVFNDSNQILLNVKITNIANGKTVYNDSLGNYQIDYVPKVLNSLKFEAAGYFNLIIAIPKLFAEEDYTYNPELSKDPTAKTSTLAPFIAFGKRRESSLGIITPNSTRPSPSGDFIDIVKMMAGVTSNNELSSQYNVRGGNYDENLIYVNDFEVYRPQLVRSGQQEGLSFINGDMVNNVNFSAGGFEARYGDKLSSVLDVSYRTPVKRTSGFQIGLLGASAYTEGIFKANKRIGYKDSTRFSYIIGARYRGNKNVLNSLDAIGLYKSRFGDVQALLTYNFNRLTRMEMLLNYAQNRYRFEPELQKTTFGTFQSALQLTIGMDGQEIMDYTSAMGGISLIRNNVSKTNEFKLMFSAVSSVESEHYDIVGRYEIAEVDNNLGSSNFGNTKNSLGFGYFINHARNDLDFTIYNIAHQGRMVLKGAVNKSAAGKNAAMGKLISLRHSAKLTYGLKYQAEKINDVFKEWKYSDSAGYNINPFPQTDSTVMLSDGARAKNSIRNQRYSGFVQAQFSFGDVDQGSVIAGARYLYTELNQQSLLSPRVQLLFEPNKKFNLIHRNDSVAKKKAMLLKAAWGYYYQAPFYREMRDFSGKLNTGLKAQRSIHYTAGMEFGFKAMGRAFRFSGEMYYKDLDYLVPYLLDNIRIRYYANNGARGYAGGADARINGEFIKGLESWFTLSFLKTDEIIRYENASGKEVESPWLRRPTDRRVSASVMFQDELKTNPDYRVHLMMSYGSGLPYYLGGEARYKAGNTIPSYKRVDIGFSKVIIGGVKTKINSKMIRRMWLGADVYNLLQINNVISYMWVKDFSNNVYGVPNYLTGRRLNLRLIVDLH